MTKNKLLDLLRKKNQSLSSKAGSKFQNGSKGKLGNSRKPVTAVQKHKGKGY